MLSRSGLSIRVPMLPRVLFYNSSYCNCVETMSAGPSKKPEPSTESEENAEKIVHELFSLFEFRDIKHLKDEESNTDRTKNIPKKTKDRGENKRLKTSPETEGLPESKRQKICQENDDESLHPESCNKCDVASTSQGKPTLEEELRSILKKCLPAIVYECRHTVYYATLSEELAFAINAMSTVRHLNGLEFRIFTYNHPFGRFVLPHLDTFQTAFEAVWSRCNAAIEKYCAANWYHKDLNYRELQHLLVCGAKRFRLHLKVIKTFEGTRLIYFSVLLCHVGVLMEKRGIDRATYFIPLALSRLVTHLIYRGPFLDWAEFAKTAEKVSMKMGV
ncbi:hypothetical protein CDAR_278751 [Caerostris darwini]|uniref:Uncharacterized protein n=1 Tax=Caerostris darwini TaxID=1538125 RepID=A0AAV4WNN4_9ARAC|nr:hypothetical protein CDAR_278751 [Caerostris darwini]